VRMRMLLGRVRERYSMDLGLRLGVGVVGWLVLRVREI